MTINKLTNDVTELDQINKINELVDYTEIDTSLSDSSVHAVQNKVVTSALASKTSVIFRDWSA